MEYKNLYIFKNRIKKLIYDHFKVFELCEHTYSLIRHGMNMVEHDDLLDSFELKHPEQLLAGLDYQLVTDFFACFSRFEHALKICGYLQDREPATVDWHRFAVEMIGRLSSVKSIRLKESVLNLTEQPPMKQRRNLEWKSSSFPKICTDSDSKAIIATTVVRNNLFHGGKYKRTDPDRDTMLLTSAMTVVHGCLLIREDVKAQYEMVM